jgi:hypothetical protein
MKNYGKKTIGVGIATLLVTGAAAMNASAATTTNYKSYAEGQYIVSTGTLGGALVDPLTDFLEDGGQFNGDREAGAQARVDTAAGTGETSPLPYYGSSPLEALDALTGPLGDLLGSTGVGVIGSYAKAERDTSHGAAGLITNEGIVDVDTATPGAPANATLNLSGPGQPLAGLNGIANVIVDLGAAGSSAKLPAPAGEPILDYGITGGGLTAQVTALSTLGTQLNGIINLLDAIQVGLPGVLAVSINGVQPVLNAITNATNDGISLSLTGPNAGTLSIDVPELLASVGVDINDLPRNTSLLNEIVKGVLGVAGDPTRPGALVGLIDGLIADITTAANGLSVDLDTLGVITNVPIGTGLTTLLGPLQTAISGVLTQVVAPITTQLGAVADQLLTALQGVLDIRVNVQHNGSNSDADPGNYVIESDAADRAGATDGVYAITALRATVLGAVVPGAVAAAPSEPLLAINLANSLVGPNSKLTTDSTNVNANVNVNTNVNANVNTNVNANVNTNVNAAANANANANANVNANGGYADGAVDTLPGAGAPNLTPFWLLGLALILFGTAVLVNEKRRLGNLS